MKSSSKTIQMKATGVASAKLRVCTVAGTRKKSNYVVNTIVWLRRVTMLYIADPVKVTLCLKIALWEAIVWWSLKKIIAVSSVCANAQCAIANSQCLKQPLLNQLKIKTVTVLFLSVNLLPDDRQCCTQ